MIVLGLLSVMLTCLWVRAAFSALRWQEIANRHGHDESGCEVCGTMRREARKGAE